MKTLTKAQVLRLHEHLIDATGGTQGIRDAGLLESAIAAPFQSFYGVDAYPTLLQKAARLGYGLIKNHPFLDGNKRSGVHVMLVFLALNGVEPVYTQSELAAAVVAVAAGEMDCDAFCKWLATHCS